MVSFLSTNALHLLIQKSDSRVLQSEETSKNLSSPVNYSTLHPDLHLPSAPDLLLLSPPNGLTTVKITITIQMPNVNEESLNSAVEEVLPLIQTQSVLVYLEEQE